MMRVSNNSIFPGEMFIMGCVIRKPGLLYIMKLEVLPIGIRVSLTILYTVTSQYSSGDRVVEEDQQTSKQKFQNTVVKHYKKGYKISLKQS